MFRIANMATVIIQDDKKQCRTSPNHVGWVYVLDVAGFTLLLVGLLDSFLHEFTDRRQALVSVQQFPR